MSLAIHSFYFLVDGIKKLSNSYEIFNDLNIYHANIYKNSDYREFLKKNIITKLKLGPNAPLVNDEYNSKDFLKDFSTLRVT